MRSLIGPVLAMVMAVPASYAGDAWRYLHPQPKVLAGIEWQRCAQSPAGRELRRQMELAGASAVAGVDLLDAVEQVVISSPGKDAGQGRAEPPVVVVLQGRFDLQRLRQTLSAQSSSFRRYRSVEILTPKRADNSPVELALVDSTTLVLAEPAQLQAALDRGGRPAALPAGLLRRAVALAARNDLWLIADMPLDQLPEQAGSQLKILSEVSGLEAGVSLQQGLNLRVNLVTKSEGSAQNLAAGVQMLLGLGLMQQAGQPQLAELARKLEIVHQASTVRMALSLDQAEMERSLNAFRAPSPEKEFTVTARPVYRGDATRTWQPPAEAEKPPEKQVVRIFGLENGPKDVLLTKP